MSDTPFGAAEHQPIITRIRDLMAEAHQLAAGLPPIDIDGVPHCPIAFVGFMDVYDAAQPHARASQVAMCAHGHQLNRILVEQLCKLPKAAQQNVIMRAMEESLAKQALAAEN